MSAASSSARLRTLGARVLADLLAGLRFYTRLPIPLFRFEAALWDGGSFGRALRAAPLAGLAVGGLGAVVLMIGARSLGLPPPVAATLALAAQILASGALHEDGLADVADGFGGGATRERKLEIMRDSRIGAFGALALLLSIAMRIAAVTALLNRYGLATAAWTLPAAAAVSRGFALLPLAVLRPARRDGLAQAAGPLGPLALGSTVACAVFLGMVLVFAAGLTESRAFGACMAGLAASLAITRLASRLIGGHTGDVAGAAQQLGEIAFLLALLVAPWRG